MGMQARALRARSSEGTSVPRQISGAMHENKDEMLSGAVEEISRGISTQSIGLARFVMKAKAHTYPDPGYLIAGNGIKTKILLGLQKVFKRTDAEFTEKDKILFIDLLYELQCRKDIRGHLKIPALKGRVDTRQHEMALLIKQGPDVIEPLLFNLIDADDDLIRNVVEGLIKKHGWAKIHWHLINALSISLEYPDYNEDKAFIFANEMIGKYGTMTDLKKVFETVNNFSLLVVPSKRLAPRGFRSARERESYLHMSWVLYLSRTKYLSRLENTVKQIFGNLADKAELEDISDDLNKIVHRTKETEELRWTLDNIFNGLEPHGYTLENKSKIEKAKVATKIILKVVPLKKSQEDQQPIAETAKEPPLADKDSALWDALQKKLDEKSRIFQKKESFVKPGIERELYEAERNILRKLTAMVKKREDARLVEDVLENMFYYTERCAFLEGLRRKAQAEKRPITYKRFTIKLDADLRGHYASSWKFIDLTQGDKVSFSMPEQLRGKINGHFSEDVITEDTYPELRDFYNEVATIAYRVEKDTLILREFPVKDKFRHRGVAAFTFKSFMVSFLKFTQINKIKFRYYALEANIFARKMVQYGFLLGNVSDEGEYFILGEKLGGPKVNPELVLKCSRDLIEALDVKKTETEANSIINRVIESIARAVGVARVSIYFPTLDNTAEIVRTQDDKKRNIQIWNAAYRLGLKGDSRVDNVPFSGEKKLYELMATRQIEPINLKDPDGGTKMVCEFKDSKWTIYDRTKLQQILSSNESYRDIIASDSQQLAADKEKYPVDYNQIKYFSEYNNGNANALRCVYWIMGRADETEEALISSVMSQVRSVHDRIRISQIIRPKIKELEEEFIRLTMNLQLTVNMRSCFFHAANKILNTQYMWAKKLPGAQKPAGEGQAVKAEGVSIDANLREILTRITSLQNMKLVETETSGNIVKIERFLERLRNLPEQSQTTGLDSTTPVASRFNVYNSIVKAETDEDVDLAVTGFPKDDEDINRSADIMREFIRQRSGWESVLEVNKKARSEFAMAVQKLSEIPDMMQKYYEYLKKWKKENQGIVELAASVPQDCRTPDRFNKWVKENEIGLGADVRYKLLMYLDIENVSELLEHLVSATSKFMRFEVKKEKVQLQSLVQEAVSLGILEAKAENFDLIPIEIDMPKEMIGLDTDPEVLKVFIISDLIKNAIKYSRPESDKITVRVQLNHEKGFIKISVEDSGYGISRQDRGKLFIAGIRLDKTKEMVSGTGLGIYLARELARSIGGELALEKSQVDRGSIFSLYLPLGERDSIWISDRSPQGAEILEKLSKMEKIFEAMAQDAGKLSSLLRSDQKAAMVDALDEMETEFARFKNNCLQGRFRGLLPEEYFYDMLETQIKPLFWQIDSLCSQIPGSGLPESVKAGREIFGMSDQEKSFIDDIIKGISDESPKTQDGNTGTVIAGAMHEEVSQSNHGETVVAAVIIILGIAFVYTLAVNVWAVFKIFRAKQLLNDYLSEKDPERKKELGKKVDTSYRGSREPSISIVKGIRIFALINSKGKMSTEVSYNKWKVSYFYFPIIAFVELKNKCLKLIGKTRQEFELSKIGLYNNRGMKSFLRKASKQPSYRPFIKRLKDACITINGLLKSRKDFTAFASDFKDHGKIEIEKGLTLQKALLNPRKENINKLFMFIYLKLLRTDNKPRESEEALKIYGELYFVLNEIMDSAKPNEKNPVKEDGDLGKMPDVLANVQKALAQHDYYFKSEKYPQGRYRLSVELDREKIVNRMESFTIRVYYEDLNSGKSILAGFLDFHLDKGSMLVLDWGGTMNYPKLMEDLDSFRRRSPAPLYLPLIDGLYGLNDDLRRNSDKRRRHVELFLNYLKGKGIDSDKEIKDHIAELGNNFENDTVAVAINEFISNMVPIDGLLTFKVEHDLTKTLMKNGKKFEETGFGRIYASNGFRIVKERGDIVILKKTKDALAGLRAKWLDVDKSKNLERLKEVASQITAVVIDTQDDRRQKLSGILKEIGFENVVFAKSISQAQSVSADLKQKQEKFVVINLIGAKKSEIDAFMSQIKKDLVIEAQTIDELKIKIENWLDQQA